MSSRRLTTALLLASLPLSACEEEPPLTACQEAANSELSLQLSSGQERFEHVPEGGHLPTYLGMQGGAHATVGVRVTGVNPGNLLNPLSAPSIQWDAWEGDKLVGSGFAQQQLVESDGAYELNGALMYVASSYARTSDEEVPVSETTQIVVIVADSCGTELVQEISVYLGNRLPEE
jgi:hypothetical protein